MINYRAPQIGAMWIIIFMTNRPDRPRKGRKPRSNGAANHTARLEPKKLAPNVYSPTEAERVLVQIGTASGVGVEYLRTLVAGGKLTPTEFKVSFAEEIANGLQGATMKVATNLFRCATAWPPIKGVTPTAMVFWLKSRAGWSGGDAGGATVTMTEKEVQAADGAAAPDKTRIIEVAFKIGDDSKIKDEDV